ncbi:MAG: zinc-ribbon domain-containing protein [Bacteroidota bacterium]
MSGKDLYAKQTCPRCGKSILEVATFCPHCGYVKEESWWRRIVDFFRSTTSSEKGSRSSSAVFSTLVGLLAAGFFLYQALQKDSIQSWFLALFALVMALRAWFSARNRAEGAEVETETALHEVDEDKPSAGMPIPQRFFCENCGTEVPADAAACPKCGMKFGSS